MLTKANLVIIGTGGFGREVLWAAREIEPCIYTLTNSFVQGSLDLGSIVFVDDNKELWGTQVCDTGVIGSIETASAYFDKAHTGGENTLFVCGVGSNTLRKAFVKRVERVFGANKFCIIEHRSVLKSEFVEVGEGSVLCAGNIITTQVKIGKHVNLNLDCTVGHDVIIEDYVNISPGVHISGYCKLKEGCDIGTGVNILPHVSIGENAVIGAGACVTRDVPANTVAVGVPAKVIKKVS